MDSAYLKRQRELFRKRYDRIRSASPLSIHMLLVQLWNYMHEQPLLAGVVSRMKASAPGYGVEISALAQGDAPPDFAFEKDATNFALRVVEYCVQMPASQMRGTQPEINIAVGQCRADLATSARWFSSHYIEPLVEAIDEALDQQAAVLSLLVKYKKKVEWFEGEELFELSKQGERRLASHLYAYLHDQGLDFHIEPQSVSGEADLVSPDLVLDAKVFDGLNRGKQYFKSGVHQLLTYARDFNQAVGYLVVYRTCPADVQFDFADETMLVPCINIGGKTLYFLVLDLCLREPSASKRGTMKAYVFNADELREEQLEAASRQMQSQAAPA